MSGHRAGAGAADRGSGLAETLSLRLTDNLGKQYASKI